MQWDGRTTRGRTRDLSYSGLLVEAPADLPAAGERCEVALEFPMGVVRAEGRVVRTDPAQHLLAVDLERLASNGELLLAVLLIS